LQSMMDVVLNLQIQEELSLSPAHIRHLLAITNEALSNVARHAQATQAQISVTTDAACIVLDVSDNGRGLPTDYVLGYGLRNIQERARLLGGVALLSSQANKGTKVQVRVPWKEIDPRVTTVAS
jgi:signal transduction histidine kinase